MQIRGKEPKEGNFWASITVSFKIDIYQIGHDALNYHYPEHKGMVEDYDIDMSYRQDRYIRVELYIPIDNSYPTLERQERVCKEIVANLEKKYYIEPKAEISEITQED